MAKQIDILCSEITLYNAWNIVKEKGAAGGIDGVTIMEFEKDKRKQISKLVDELANKTWKPYPYLEIEIAKDKSPEEKRKLGMTAIRDKIVQLAIKTIIEPRYDRIFVGNSYGNRPGKGATKAIRRVLQECKNKKYKYVLRLDIDNFFDSIDHFLLRRKLVARDGGGNSETHHALYADGKGKTEEPRMDRHDVGNASRSSSLPTNGKLIFAFIRSVCYQS